MTKSFILKVVEDLLQATGGDFKNTAIIVPNLRSGGVFQQELIRQMTKPSWSPGIFSIDDWLVDLSGLTRTDKLVELASLFKVVSKEIPSISSFADFIDLGETILADFEDTDKYLVDPMQLFTTLNEIKKIDNQFDITSDMELVDRIRVFWSSFGAGHSAHQEKWLEIWDKMYLIYDRLHKHLIDNGMGTSGMCYRKTVEDLTSDRMTPGRFTNIVFAGFNILTAAEEAVFSHLKERQMASFYWDYHPFYLDGNHEAGKFILDYLKMFPEPAGFKPFAEGERDFYRSVGKNSSITVVPVTSNTGQVQALLNDIGDGRDSSRGIILSDEGLFSDLLSSWPEGVPVNFTSGYPLGDTQAAGFFLNLISIYLDFDQSAGNHTCKAGLLLAFLRHPWTAWLIGESAERCTQVIRKRYPELVPADFVNGEESLSRWIGTHKSAPDFLHNLEATAQQLMVYEARYSNMEKGAIGMMVKQSAAFRGVIETHQLDLDSRALSKLFTRMVHSGKISLETDRKANNQVTGVLETRLLDFDDIYILSFNEGIWPSKSLPGSLIPFSMRKVFGLPTAENRDAMYAYYFYRLIQRAGSLHIYYLTGHRDDVIRSGEKSRYITQLTYELPEILVRPEPPARVGEPVRPVIIRKEGVVKERLDRYLTGQGNRKSLSPSAINEYLDCSLRFALRRIYDFREPDEIAYAAEPKGFGTLIHQVMNLLYADFIGKETGPDPEWLKGIIKDQDKLAEIILQQYSVLLKDAGGIMPGGKELLALEVVRQYLVKILEVDQRELPRRILGLEESFKLDYPFRPGTDSASCSLNGVIDRIDEIDEGIRIIDYKTGNIELNTKVIGDIFDRSASKRPKEIFQVFLYCEFFLRRSAVTRNLIPALFRLGRFRAGDYDYRIQISGNGVSYAGVREEFIAGFNGILQEIFDYGIPFTQTENLQTCRYCPFTAICSRENHS
jgi:hypothetical protein